MFSDMIADIISNKKLQPIIKELFIRCRKLNMSLVFITQSYFSIPRDIILNSKHYLTMNIHNKRQLQNFAINHLVDIDYKDFVKIYRECTKEPYFLSTDDTTLPASSPLRFRKICFILMKKTMADQIKILDRKIKQNETQYDLDKKKIAKISPLSSRNLNKYEYLTGEYLDYKQRTAKKARFEYSPLGKFYDEGLENEDKKEGRLKRLENIEDKNEEQLKAIKEKTDIKSQTDLFN